MATIDLLFSFLLIGALLVGFFHGTFHATILLLTFYLCLIISCLYFPLVSVILAKKFGSETFVAEYVSFILILVSSFTFFAIAFSHTFQATRPQEKFALLDRITGAFIGLFLATLFIIILTIVLWNLMITREAAHFPSPIMQLLGQNVQHSRFIKYLGLSISTQIYSYLQQILPEEARRILTR